MQGLWSGPEAQLYRATFEAKQLEKRETVMLRWSSVPRAFAKLDETEGERNEYQ